MSGLKLRERCRINTNIDADTFVGIKAIDGDISINFPLGYRFEEDEKGLRKDIILLLNILSKHTDRKDSEYNNEMAFNEVNLPIQAYLYLIYDYYSRGYYKETESIKTISKRGKIDWGRTIKTQKGYIQDDDVYYLEYATKKNNTNEKELITLIHKYCVYESFSNIGWIYTDVLPEKPQIPFNKKLFLTILKKKISQTYNDRNRQLLRHMLAIILSLGNDGHADYYSYGTGRFEYVWESMIDSVFGIAEKDKYFPKTRWLINGREHKNNSLEPDTIMIYNNTVYVLDAKYYKYGWSGIASHLPDSASISKQITYGEYIAESKDLLDENGNHPNVYNAFIMPYDALGDTFCTGEKMHYIGEAISDWKSSDGTKPYEKVEGILLDVKTLMRERTNSQDMIIELANLIESKINGDKES